MVGGRVVVGWGRGRRGRHGVLGRGRVVVGWGRGRKRGRHGIGGRGKSSGRVRRGGMVVEGKVVGGGVVAG